MNNDIKRLTGALLASAAVLLAGCSKEDPVPAGGVPVSDLSAPVALSAGIEAAAISKAPITGNKFPALDPAFGLTAWHGASAPAANGNWTAANLWFEKQSVKSDANGALTIVTPQYYPADGSKLFFYAYAPVAGATFTAGTPSAAPIVNYTIDGTQDIMAAQATNGYTKTSAQPALQFTHKLKQVKFKVLKDNTSMGSENVSLTKIEIVGVKNKAKLNIADGKLTFDAATDNLTAYTGNMDLTTTAKDAGQAMFEEGKTFKVAVTAGGVPYADAEITLSTEGRAGESHEVTLTIKRNGIVPTAAITEWIQKPNSGSADIR